MDVASPARVRLWLLDMVPCSPGCRQFTRAVSFPVRDMRHRDLALGDVLGGSPQTLPEIVQSAQRRKEVVLIADALSSSAKYGTDLVDRAVDVAPVDYKMILGGRAAVMSNVRFIAHF